MKKMKKFFAVLLAAIICFSTATTSFAATTKIEGIIPGTKETYEYVESAHISIPESDWVFTFENLTAIAGYTEKTHPDFSRNEPIPTYRFTILGNAGGFSIDNDAWIVCHYIAEEIASFDGDLAYEANSFETFSLPYGCTKGYRTYQVAVKETSESDSIVACVEICFGEYIEKDYVEGVYVDNNLLLSSYYNTVDVDNFIINLDNNIAITLNIQPPSTTTIRNNDGIVLHANIEGNAPEGSYIVWTSNNNNFSEDADGNELEIIAKNKGYTTFTAILYDVDGNELVRDSIEMYSKSGFFDKIGGFFRSLFGGTKIYEN